MSNPTGARRRISRGCDSRRRRSLKGRLVRWDGCAAAAATDYVGRAAVAPVATAPAPRSSTRRPARSRLYYQMGFPRGGGGRAAAATALSESTWGCARDRRLPSARHWRQRRGVHDRHAPSRLARPGSGSFGRLRWPELCQSGGSAASSPHPFTGPPCRRSTTGGCRRYRQLLRAMHAVGAASKAAPPKMVSVFGPSAPSAPSLPGAQAAVRRCIMQLVMWPRRVWSECAHQAASGSVSQQATLARLR